MRELIINTQFELVCNATRAPCFAVYANESQAGRLQLTPSIGRLAAGHVLPNDEKKPRYGDYFAVVPSAVKLSALERVVDALNSEWQGELYSGFISWVENDAFLSADIWRGVAFTPEALPAFLGESPRGIANIIADNDSYFQGLRAIEKAALECELLIDFEPSELRAWLRANLNEFDFSRLENHLKKGS